jgi:hypothetical protein
VAPGALRNVLPVTGYVALMVLAVADAGTAVAATVKAAAKATRPAVIVVRIRRGLKNLICAP